MGYLAFTPLLLNGIALFGAVFFTLYKSRFRNPVSDFFALIFIFVSTSPLWIFKTSIADYNSDFFAFSLLFILSPSILLTLSFIFKNDAKESKIILKYRRYSFYLAGALILTSPLSLLILRLLMGNSWYYIQP